MKKFIAVIFLGLSISGFSQQVHSATVITNVPVREPSTLPITPVIATSESIIFKAEESIVLSPEGPDGFEAKATGTNYFLAMISPLIYAEMRDKLDASFVEVNGILKFKYEERYISGENLNFKIYNYKRELVTVNTTVLVPKLGANYLDLNLSSFTNLAVVPEPERNYYILEIKNSKGELKLLRFKLI